MEHAHPKHPITNLLIAGLVREGYDVRSCPVHGKPPALPAGCHVVMRLGEPGEDRERSAIGVDLTANVAGDIATGVTRRWRFARALRSGRDTPPMFIDGLLVLDGDVSTTWIEQDGATAYQMLCQLLLDVRATLLDMPSVPFASSPLPPSLVIDMKVLGDIATGRSGLTRRKGVSQCLAEADRAARLAMCDRLLSDALPAMRALCLTPRSQKHVPQPVEPITTPMCAAGGG